MNRHAKKPTPPKWIDRFLEWYCADSLIDEIQGDLHESYCERFTRRGPVAAKLWFLIEVMLFFRPSSFGKRSRHQRSTMMHASYFKIAYRSFLRYRAFGFTNLSGLALGIAAFLLMTQYIETEKSFDRHFSNHERIFRLASQKVQDGVPQDPKSSASVALAPFIKASMPQVEQVVRVHKLDAAELIVTIIDEDGRQQVFQETKGYHAGGAFFEVFETPFVYGRADEALSEPNAIVLTESTSLKYFGDINPVGKSIVMLDDFEMSYKITGVVQDVPVASHFKYDFLISFSTFQKQRPNWRWSSWDWDYFHTYVKLLPGADPETFITAVNSGVAEQAQEVFQERNYAMNFLLQPLTAIHLQSSMGNEFEVNGRGEMLDYLRIIAAFILLMAWVNYLNLSTAKSAIRAREVGVRKVAGAYQNSLIGQFMMEALLMNFAAIVVGLGLVFGSVSFTPILLSYKLTINWQEVSFWLLLVEIWLAGTLLSGGYPAFVMAKFKPLNALKGKVEASIRGIGLRSVLLTSQFFISILLITLTVSVFRQLDFMKTRSKGFDGERVLMVHRPKLNSEDNFWQRFDRFSNENEAHSDIVSISASNAYPGFFLNHVELFKKAHEQRGDADILKFYAVDYDLIDTYGLQLTGGRDFDQNRTSNLYEVILNEKAAATLGFDSPSDAIEQPVTWIHSYGAMTDCKVVGIVKDFDNDAMTGVEPVVMFLNRPFERWNGIEYFSVRLRTQDKLDALNRLEASFQQIFPGNHFSYFFLDDRFNQAFESERRFGRILNVFTLFGIFISVLGLVALSSFSLLRRTKELSIRRVLGATTKNLVLIMSRQYMILAAVAIFIALPLAFWVLGFWMDNFPHRVPFHIGVYLVPIVVMLAIIWTITGVLVVKSAAANPSEQLRVE